LEKNVWAIARHGAVQTAFNQSQFNAFGEQGLNVAYETAADLVNKPFFGKAA
jgi:hypothetical protein